jgi:hypothetical protein
MKMRFLMTLMFVGLCVSVPRAQGAEGHAGDSGKKVASIPVDVSTFAHEIDQLVADELKRLDQEPRPEIDDYTFCRRIYLDAIGRIPTIDELESLISESYYPGEKEEGPGNPGPKMEAY